MKVSLVVNLCLRCHCKRHPEINTPAEDKRCASLYEPYTHHIVSLRLNVPTTYSPGLQPAALLKVLQRIEDEEIT